MLITAKQKFLNERKEIFQKFELTFDTEMKKANGKKTSNVIPIHEFYEAFKQADSFGRGQEFWEHCWFREKWVLAQFLPEKRLKTLGWDEGKLKPWHKPPPGKKKIWSVEEKSKVKILLFLKEEGC
jgi:hypothetical protein